MTTKAGILILFLAFSGSMAFAQKADAILGSWANPSGEDHILIYKKGNKYFCANSTGSNFPMTKPAKPKPTNTTPMKRCAHALNLGLSC